MQRFINVIDIGSEKISAITGGRGVNGSFNIKAYLTENYAGFVNSEFIDLKSLKLALGTMITNLERMNKTEFSSCFIGVPAQFCICQTSSATLNFAKEKKINDSIVNELCEVALAKIKQNDNYALINRSPIYFESGNGRKVLDASSLITDKITAEISFVFAEKNFIRSLSKMLKEIGVFKFDFIASSLAQGLFIFGEEERESECLLIDCGYITTSIALIKGEGLLELNALSLGGASITADLSEVLKIKFKEAEELKKNIILSIDQHESDVYNIDIPGKTIRIEAKMANEICEARIEDIASKISKYITAFKETLSPNVTAYLTGGGLSYLRGAKDLLSKLIARPVENAKIPALSYRRQTNSSAISLLNFALLITEANKGGY